MLSFLDSTIMRLRSDLSEGGGLSGGVGGDGNAGGVFCVRRQWQKMLMICKVMMIPMAMST